MVVAFPKNEIQVTNLENGLKVTTRFNEFELNTKGDLVNVYLTIDRKLHIFQADGDGLELFSIDGSPLNLLSSTVKGTVIAPNTYSGDLSVIYEYENGVRKILTFKNAPEYVITVEIESADSVVVTLPRVWYEENDRAVKRLFSVLCTKKQDHLHFKNEWLETGFQ